MKLSSIITLMGFTFIFSPVTLYSQDNADTGFYQQAMANTLAVYHQSFGDQSALYNGPQYGEYLFLFSEGHPFFHAAEPGLGSVVYAGISYDSILMRFNEVTDELIINARSFRLQLPARLVTAFRLYNADFIRLEKDSLANSPVSSGYYNVLYQGKITLLKKQIKTIREVISTTMELQHFVDEKNYYYIKMNNHFYTIKSKSELFKLFGDHKKDLQQYAKANDLNFRNDREKMLAKVTAYYDSLKK